MAQLLLAWAIRDGDVLAIPKASSLVHVRENAAALDITLSEEDCLRLDRAFPPPQHKLPLDVV